MTRLLWGLVSFVLAATPGCTTILGLDAKPLAEADAAVDAGPPCTADDAGYDDPKVAACWTVYSLPLTLDSQPQYSGASFDGRYVYFVNNTTGFVVRHDVTAPFEAPSSWTGYDTTALQGEGPLPYAGAIFDGRYVYFVPVTPFGSSSGGAVLRHDTRGDFASSASWSAYQPNPSTPVSFAGGTFDGRYLYLSPVVDLQGNVSGVVTRYDSTASFTEAAGWSTFDVTKAGGADAPNAGAFYGAVFDGRYVYFVPGAQALGVVARYDSTATFGSATAWAFFNTNLASNLGSGSFSGGAFDGRFLYLAPSTLGAPAFELDLRAPFTAVASWRVHIPDSSVGGSRNGLAPGVAGAAYDGRHLYFIPGPPQAVSISNGELGVYDGHVGAFTDGGRWSTFDTTTLDTTTLDVSDFGASVFDGRYLYLAPGSGGPFARFEARATSSQPPLPHYFGSFF